MQKDNELMFQQVSQLQDSSRETQEENERLQGEMAAAREDQI